VVETAHGMKRFGATYLFALVVAALVGFTAYDYWSSQKKEAAEAEQAKIVRLDPSGLHVIEIEGKNTLRLEKKDGHWFLTKPFDESADQQVVMTFIDQLVSEKIVMTVAENADLVKYGLDQPILTLRLVSGGATPGGEPSTAETETVKIGRIRAYDNSLFAQINDEKRVVLVNSSWDVMLSKLPSDFRDTKLYHGPMKVDFDKIKVTDKKTGFEIDRIDGKYVLKNSIEPIYQPSVQAWLEQIKALRGAAFVNSPKPGFRPEYTITLERDGGEPYVLKIAHDPEHPHGQYELTSTDLPGRFTSRVLAGQTALNPVMVKTDVFYNKKSPFEFDPKSVARVKFHDEKTGKNVDAKVDPKHPDEFLAKVAQLEAVRFLGPRKAEKKFPSHLTLLNSEGNLVFEMSWGRAVVEKATEERPEARYLPVVTNLSKQVVGVPEKLIDALAAEPEDAL
jgi:hypothetical protein